MELKGRIPIREWQLVVVVCLFGLGTISLAALPFAEKPGQSPGFLEAAYYSLGLFLGAGNPVGFPSMGPAWAVWSARLAYFGAPLILAWTIIEAILRMTQSLFDRPEKAIAKMEGHVVVCGLGKLGNAVVDWNRRPDDFEVPVQGKKSVFRMRDVVVLEKDSENPRVAQLRERGIPVLIGDQTQEKFLQKAGLERAHQLVAVSGDDIANLDAAHVARRLNSKLDVRCQVTNLQLQKLVQTASSIKIHSFNSYHVAAKEMINRFIKERVGEQEEPVFVLAGIGRFGQMMIENLIALYKERALKLIIVDRNGEHIARIARGVLTEAEEYLKPGTIYEGEIADPYLWRTIRDDHSLVNATVVLCTDDDISNINTALMIGEQVGQEILVVSRMFRDVAFMEKSQDKFKVAVLSQLIQQGLAESLFE